MKTRALLAGAAILVLLALSLAVGPSGPSWPGLSLFLALRVPRAVLAALVGASLGLSGAALQGAFRNPLADPGLLGIGACASLGAVLCFYFGLAAHFAPALPLAGMAGAALGAVLLLRFAGAAPTGTALILAGIALSAFAGALLALSLALAPNPFALSEITFWLLGSLSDRTLSQLALATPPILAGCALLASLGRRLDALSLGEPVAASLGYAPGRTLRLVAAGTACAVGAATAVTGGIGFVGLAVPHLLRPIVGHRPAALLLPSALGGAALLLAADLAVRAVPLAQPLPIGVITALLGAPFLVWIARRAAFP